MRRQYCLWRRAHLGLCSQGSPRLLPGVLQLSQALAWCWLDAENVAQPQHRAQPSLAMQLSAAAVAAAAGGILSKLANATSRSVQTPSSTTPT